MKRTMILILLVALASTFAEDVYRIVEVSKNTTDWSATVSLNGRQPQALTFPLGKRPTDEAIITTAKAVEAARKAAEATAATNAAPNPTEVWTVTVQVAGKPVVKAWPAGMRPSAEDMKRAVETTAATTEVPK